MEKENCRNLLLEEYGDKIIYEDDEIIEVEDDFICDRCNGLGCYQCDGTGKITAIITFDKNTCEEIDFAIKYYYEDYGEDYE